MYVNAKNFNTLKNEFEIFKNENEGKIYYYKDDGKVYYRKVYKYLPHNSNKNVIFVRNNLNDKIYVYNNDPDKEIFYEVKEGKDKIWFILSGKKILFCNKGKGKFNILENIFEDELNLDNPQNKRRLREFLLTSLRNFYDEFLYDKRFIEKKKKNI